MTTAAMKRMNTHGTTTLAGATSDRGFLLPMPDTTTTTTHGLGGTPVGVVVARTIAFYPSGGKCTAASRVRHEQRNPEVGVSGTSSETIRGVSYVASVPAGKWCPVSLYSSSLQLFRFRIQTLCWPSNSSSAPTASVSAAVALGPAVSCRRQHHTRAADGAPPPPGSCLMCTRCSRLCHPLVCICTPTCSSKRTEVALHYATTAEGLPF